MSLRTPNEIRTLQRKLYAKAKQEPAFRFYALYDKVHRADILSHAYDLVRANRGAPGIDGVTCKVIEAGSGKGAYLGQLQEELERKTYRADGVRRVWIPKPDGSKRPLGPGPDRTDGAQAGSGTDLRGELLRALVRVSPETLGS